MRTVRDSIQPYLSARLAAGQLRPGSATNQRYILNDWATVCGDRPLERLSHRDVDRLERYWHGVAPSTRRMRYSVVRAWHRWCVQRDLVSPTLFDTLVPPKEPRRPPRALSADQIRRLVDACEDSRMLAMLLWSVQLGLRCCELARLHYSDIDVTNCRVRVTGKGDHERVLPIPAEAMAALEGYWGDCGIGRGPLFRRFDTGEALQSTTIVHLFWQLFKRAGVKRQAYDGLSAHALRHTMATDLLRSGKANLMQVKAALGHASVATTQIYLSAIEADDLADVMSGRSYMAG